jgi:hypothetical protein
MKRKSIWFLLLCNLSLPALVPAEIIQWTVASGGNGNYYEYVSAPSIFQGVNFGQAKAGAEARSHLGLNGYLATITSAAENQFLSTSFTLLYGFGNTTSTYFGATDEATDGTFRWVGGPEAGEALSYTNFVSGQGNEVGVVNQLAMYNIADPLNSSNGKWFVYNGQNGALGYFVEYGPERSNGDAVPEPSTWFTAGSAIVVLAFGKLRRCLPQA